MLPPLFELPPNYPSTPNSPIVNTTNIFSYQQIPSTYSSLSPWQENQKFGCIKHTTFWILWDSPQIVTFTRTKTLHSSFYWNNAFITTNLIFQKSGEKCYKTRASNNGPLFFDANEKVTCLLRGLYWMGFQFNRKKWQQFERTSCFLVLLCSMSVPFFPFLFMMIINLHTHSV